MKKRLSKLAIISVLFCSITGITHAIGFSEHMQNGFNALVYHALQFDKVFPGLNPLNSAIEEFKLSIEDDVSTGDAHLILGMIYENVGNSSEAIAHYTKFAELNPNDDWVYTMIGDIYFSVGEDDLALDAYRMSNDEYARTQAGRANIAMRSGQYSEAKEGYEQALSQAPDFLMAYIGLGKAHFYLGEWDEAAQTLEMAQIISPRSEIVYQYLALTYDALERPKQAEHARERLRELQN